MTEGTLNRDDVAALGDQAAREEVPEVVQADVLRLRSLPAPASTGT